MISRKLIEECRNKDANAYREVYNICAPYVYSIVKNYISDNHYRKDAMQESFAHIFVSMKNYDASKGKFKSWVSSVVVNQCVNIIRKNYKIPLEGLSHLSDVDLSYNAFSNLDQLNQDELDKLLTKMPIGYKTVFLLSVMEEYSHKEIANVLNITPETSRSQLMRGLTWIRKNVFRNSKQFAYERI